MKELKIIHLFFSNSLQQSLTNLPIFIMFLFSKICRFGMFAGMLFLMAHSLKTIGGYTASQMLIFYLVFNLVDTLAQLLFREVYRFRPMVVSGGLDMVLTKPLNPLVRVLFGGPDLIDAGMVIILLIVLAYALLQIHPGVASLLLMAILIVNSLLISAAFHVFVLGLGVITLNVDHLIMIYRDITALVRIPVDLFPGFLRAILTFVIPVGIMFTFPVKALFGLLSWPLVLISFIFGLLGILFAIKFWNYSLKSYQSASS